MKTRHPPTRKMLWITLLTIIGIAGALYALMCLILYLAQSHLVYHPERILTAYPSDIGLKYEKIVVETEDKERITGWFVPAAQPRATILFCHGNAGNLSHRIETVRILHELNFDLLIFDYRGYGQSTGAPTEEGTYLDARAMWNYLTTQRNIAPNRILLFGRSLGGAVAAALAEQVQPAGIILESTFTSILDIGAEFYPFLPVRLATRFRYDTLERLPRIECPVLVIHSREDRLVPFHHGLALFEAAPGPRRFLEIVGPHNDGFLLSALGYMAGLDDFARIVMKDTSPPAPPEANRPAKAPTP